MHFCLHNTKCVTSYKAQEAEREKKHNWKHHQGTVISVNEVWNRIFKFIEVITNMNLVMIQTTPFESRTGKSLQNPDNPKNNNFPQSDFNFTNNPCPNEFIQSKSICNARRHLVIQDILKTGTNHYI